MPIKIIKNRSDIGAGTRGSDMGIDAVEIAAINQKDDYFNLYPFVDVPTDNESVYNKVHTFFAKRIGFVKEHCQRVCKAVSATLSEGFFPVVLSGDHSSALGTISGIKSKYPDKRLGVIWIDAHADLHSPYTSPSGNVHGMPIAAAMQEDNKKCGINSICEPTLQHWETFKNTGTQSAKFLAEDLIFFGVRDTEPPEDRLIQEKNIRNYSVAEMRFRGFTKCLKEAAEKLTNCQMIYISFDVDSMDCDSVSYGTGTPVSKGFEPAEVLEIIKYFISKKLVCFEISEINPLLDKQGNQMAATTFKILKEATRLIKNLYENSPHKAKGDFII